MRFSQIPSRALVALGRPSSFGVEIAGHGSQDPLHLVAFLEHLAGDWATWWRHVVSCG